MGDERRGHQRITRASLIFAGLAVCLARGADAQEIGRDVTELHPCLYGDCEARGTYAADPFGFTNPATMPVGTLTYMSRGLFVSGSHFRFNAGGVGLNIDSPSVTVAVDPWVFQASVVYAEGGGAARSLPGTHLSLRTRLVRLATAVDLGRTALGITGLSVGLLAGVPGTTSELRLTSGGLSLVDSRESHEVGLTGGVHWRGGRRDWFNVGAFVDAERHHESMQEFDPMTLTTTEQHGVSNAWFARAGLSLLPFVPLGLTEAASPVSELLGEVRVAADLEHRNISALGENTRARQTGFFGIDARLLPDAWNLLSDYLRTSLIGGTDTDAGWGIGAGLYGNGALEVLSCNPAYSSRPLAKSLGDRVDVWSATCSVALPL